MNSLENLEAIGFFDLETTGLDVHSVRIVTASVGVLLKNGDVEKVQNWLINPGVPIPETASAVHGVTDEIASTHGAAPIEAISEIVTALNEIFSRNLPVVAFNAAYDFSIIVAEATRNNLLPPSLQPVFDPLVIDRRFNKYRRGKRTLVSLAEQYQLPLLNAHTAEADAIAAAMLAFRQIGEQPDVARATADELHEQQVGWAEEQAADFEAFIKQQRPDHVRSERGWPVRKKLS